MFPCSVVLTGKSGCTGTQCDSRHIKKLRQLSSTYLCRNINASKSIDAALKDHTSQVIDGTHKSHAESCPKHFRYEFPWNLPFFSSKTDLRIIFQNIEPSKSGADPLRKHGCSCCSLYTKVQGISNKKEVQSHIEEAAEQEKTKRRHTVSHRLKQGRLQVVGHRQRNTCQNDGQIA